MTAQWSARPAAATRLTSCQCRTLFGFGKRQPVVDPASPEQLAKVKQEREDQEAKARANFGSGRLADSSIFAQTKPATPKVRSPKAGPKPAVDLNKLVSTGVDPNPRARIKWERRKLLRHVQGRGRLTRAEQLLKTERQMTSASPLFKTSVKKLMPLARQIKGKPLQEAMVQMRFSKKKAASDVLKHLEYAQNAAVVQRRMGLQLGPTNLPMSDNLGQEGQPREVVIRDKGNKRRVIRDKSAMYVDQAWVGRGPYKFGRDYRARGRAHKLYLPYTSKSFVVLSIAISAHATGILLFNRVIIYRDTYRIAPEFPSCLPEAISLL